ncbi:MAG TPA: chemotaxis protein CheB [Polyangiales bacterium]|nr:chemotaxis protein CheB [Polyangiales bacterium]
MSRRTIVVVGASAGGVEALISLARALPGDVHAAFLAVLHVPPHGNSGLARLLDRAGPLPAALAEEGERIVAGRWYVARPDHHLLIAREGTVHLGRGPTENGHRPAIDALFRSAAHAFGSSVIGVVLSGSLDDGTAGLLTIKLVGGLAMAQDPEEAVYPSMPQSAIVNVAVDHVGTVVELAATIVRLVKESAAPPKPIMDAVRQNAGNETRIAEDGVAAIDEEQRRGVPSAFACPDCNGVLWEVREGELVRFRCRVGHAYLPQALSVAQSDRLEESLWIALRTLKESNALSQRLAVRATERGMSHVAAAYEVRALEAEQRAAVIEDVLKRGRLSAGVEDMIPADAHQISSRKVGSR